nr:phosphotransferase [Gemmatimonadaceae bacterium]
QRRRLRAVAMRAIAAWELPSPPRLRLVAHGFNATWRVDASGRRFALRLNVASQRTPANIAGEMAWMAALSRDTTLVLPVPQPLPDGALLHVVDASEVGRHLPAVLFSWLPGRDLGRRDDPAALHALGAAMARLHAHGATWSPPPGAAFPIADDVLCHQPPSLLVDAHPALPPARQALFVDVHRRAAAMLAALWASQPHHVTHFDLHMWNVKWRRGRLALFDFDDSAIACPLQDLAITTYYLRSRPGGDRLEAALLDGYATIAAPPIASAEHVEALLTARALLLANDLLRIENAEERAYLPTFLARTERTLRRYLDTGRFAPELAVPGPGS